MESILDVREQDAGREYLLTWTGFGREEDSWEPLRNLGNVRAMVQQFEEARVRRLLRHEMAAFLVKRRHDQFVIVSFQFVGISPDFRKFSNSVVDPSQFRQHTWSNTLVMY